MEDTQSDNYIPIAVKALILAVITLVFFATLVLVSRITPPSSDAEPPVISTIDPNATPTPTPIPLSYTIDNIVVFLNEFESDASSARKKYTGKLIELTGIVRLVGENARGEKYVCINGGDTESWVYAQCFTAENINNIAIGDQVTLRGIVSDYMIVVSLTDCTLSEIVKQGS